ncbi:hypothetical protein LCGC14_3108210, partial [marine sediment metagenome]
MAVTFENLKTKLGDWLDMDTTRLPDSVRGDIINIVMREILRKRDLRFGETSDTFATVASTRNYLLPTGWSRPQSLWYQNPDTLGITFLTFLNKDEFDLKFPDSTKEADPSNFTVWAGNIQLGKTPERILTINRNYYAILADLADGSPDNENDFTKNAWEVLLYGGLKESSRYG